ncbi:hypothetical protein [Streptomyces sp. MK37H]|uniref:hypothetical protein n=1 Tax=Streptomyces sp. MK37H TaxID=2699117 RepID=UPI001B39106F|nr:hypothetical protein [Streptomyces sp. MK37H]MBP8536108.1 hypothetical protein [Streptomyces sp. MK37H]
MTTETPYTDADLRAAAALMHYAMSTEPNPSDAGAALSDNPRWLLITPGSEQDEHLRESVVELVSGAADISRWAVDLGTDGLQPDEHELTWRAGRQPIVRVHFAFHDGMSDEARDYLVQAVGEALGGVMDTAAQGAEPTD